MTKERLEQIPKLKIEIQHLQKEINNLPTATDKVKGSMASFPYIERSFTISGSNVELFDRLNYRLQRKLIKLQKELATMEDWLDGVEDSEMRTILRLKYRNGLTDAEIGNELGYSRTGINMKVNRFFDKLKVCHN